MVMVRFRNYFKNLYLHMKTEWRYTFLFCFDLASADLLQPVSREVWTKSSPDLEVVTELFLGTEVRTQLASRVAVMEASARPWWVVQKALVTKGHQGMHCTIPY